MAAWDPRRTRTPRGRPATGGRAGPGLRRPRCPRATWHGTSAWCCAGWRGEGAVRHVAPARGAPRAACLFGESSSVTTATPHRLPPPHAVPPAACSTWAAPPPTDSASSSSTRLPLSDSVKPPRRLSPSPLAKVSQRGPPWDPLRSATRAPPSLVSPSTACRASRTIYRLVFSIRIAKDSFCVFPGDVRRSGPLARPRPHLCSALLLVGPPLPRHALGHPPSPRLRPELPGQARAPLLQWPGSPGGRARGVNVRPSTCVRAHNTDCMSPCFSRQPAHPAPSAPQFSPSACTPPALRPARTPVAALPRLRMGCPGGFPLPRPHPPHAPGSPWVLAFHDFRP